MRLTIKNKKLSILMGPSVILSALLSVPLSILSLPKIGPLINQQKLSEDVYRNNPQVFSLIYSIRPLHILKQTLGANILEFNSYSSPYGSFGMIQGFRCFLVPLLNVNDINLTKSTPLHFTLFISFKQSAWHKRQLSHLFSVP